MKIQKPIIIIVMLTLLLVVLVIGGQWFVASAAPLQAIQAPVLKWAHGGCYSSWCETGWYSSPAVADLDGNGSMEVIAEGLKSLRLLHGDVAGLIEGGAVRLFYPHGIGHLLGLDVHDGTGGKGRKIPNPTKVPLRFVTRFEPG